MPMPEARDQSPSLTEPLLQEGGSHSACYGGRAFVLLILVISFSACLLSLLAPRSLAAQEPTVTKNWAPSYEPETLLGSTLHSGAINPLKARPMPRQARKVAAASGTQSYVSTGHATFAHLPVGFLDDHVPIASMTDGGSRWRWLGRRAPLKAGRSARSVYTRVATEDEQGAVLVSSEDDDAPYCLTEDIITDGCEEDEYGEECPIPRNFYDLLNVDQDATPEEIKKSYRRIHKACHPDIAGQDANDVCVLVHEAYETLKEPPKRAQYDMEIEADKYEKENDVFMGYTGKLLSRWNDDPEQPVDPRAIFVDESECIGCRMCNNIAPETFGIEELWGRARVHTQWGNSYNDTEDAVQMCPVECIYIVPKAHVPVLEWCMTKTEKKDIASMMAYSARGEDPFELARDYIMQSEERRGRLRSTVLSDAEKDWTVPGYSEEHVRFSLNMANAWEKLKRKTKEAWRPVESVSS